MRLLRSYFLSQRLSLPASLSLSLSPPPPLSLSVFVCVSFHVPLSAFFLRILFCCCHFAFIVSSSFHDFLTTFGCSFASTLLLFNCRGVSVHVDVDVCAAGPSACRERSLWHSATGVSSPLAGTSRVLAPSRHTQDGGGPGQKVPN